MTKLIEKSQWWWSDYLFYLITNRDWLISFIKQQRLSYNWLDLMHFEDEGDRLHDE
jgi:hypothetical protein